MMEYKLYPNDDGTFTITQSGGDISLRISGREEMPIAKEEVDKVLEKGKDKFVFDKKSRTLKEKKEK